MVKKTVDFLLGMGPYLSLGLVKIIVPQNKALLFIAPIISELVLQIIYILTHKENIKIKSLLIGSAFILVVFIWMIFYLKLI